MDRINHIKIVSPDPEAIDRFLQEVVQIPAGWKLGNPPDGYVPPEDVPSPARDDKGEFTLESVHDFRGAGGFGGVITGSTESRQFQLLRGDKPHIWAVAIGTRDIDGAHERCVAAGIPCTDPGIVPGWGANGEGAIRFFYAEVGGVVFEVMKAESRS
jgi:catechol 2,3-dioxygenase-like lactoylglutathione lyase family enzyme